MLMQLILLTNFFPEKFATLNEMAQVSISNPKSAYPATMERAPSVILARNTEEKKGKHNRFENCLTMALPLSFRSRERKKEIARENDRLRCFSFFGPAQFHESVLIRLCAFGSYFIVFSQHTQARSPAHRPRNLCTCSYYVHVCLVVARDRPILLFRFPPLLCVDEVATAAASFYYYSSTYRGSKSECGGGTSRNRIM